NHQADKRFAHDRIGSAATTGNGARKRHYCADGINLEFYEFGNVVLCPLTAPLYPAALSTSWVLPIKRGCGVHAAAHLSSPGRFPKIDSPLCLQLISAFKKNLPRKAKENHINART